jgi:hypothetical protein
MYAEVRANGLKAGCQANQRFEMNQIEDWGDNKAAE